MSVVTGLCCATVMQATHVIHVVQGAGVIHLIQDCVAGGGEDMWHRVQAQEGVIKELLRRCSQLEAKERSRNEPAEGSAAHEYRMNLVAYQVMCQARLKITA
jgi:hypothetical protein